jgi:hypothetical protein
MLRYNANLYDLLVYQMEVIGITEIEAQAVCDALCMDDTSNLYYLTKKEVMSLSCISTEKKRQLWKLIEEVKRDPRFAPVIVMPSFDV